ncbi:RagB/SusD family nutrient uptake outer membrane protein [Flavobacterium algicola]|uniref:RagB/SusD family nutrient uptake outer membrane protein n=1 Tax=Flavobacterium algicola TaxID=556529 RepID=UPI001EFEBEFD|nr:RagB/SusD family nutrient uptake outer membrane protein [Flavobacterium algicola]MCG9793725.1 RagB/SusD family nutrient uptake outer membrane protein [Flavobacterium algicola]
MKLNNIVIKNARYCLIAAAALLASCSNELEGKVYGTPILENFYKNSDDAEQGINAAYNPMREMYGKENFWAGMSCDLTFGDVGTDDFIKGGISVVDNVPLYQKESYNIPTSNLAVSRIWQINYKGILYCNLILSKVPDIEFIDTTRKKEILAEAQFMRAYYYFDLVNSFGGVPIIDRPLEQGEFNVPRSTEHESYTFIENDLKAAIANLPSRFEKPQSYTGHADKGAALGLMMRVSIYQNKMDQVKIYGDQLFALGYSLFSNYSSIFQTEGEWNSGSIFEINYTTNTSLLGTSIPQFISPVSKKGYACMQAKPDLINEFETNDPRLTATFYQTPVTYGTGWFIRKYAWAPFSNYPTPSVGGNNNSANNIRVIRLADAYLMYAEAVYSTNPSEAIKYVNLVRARARGSNSAILPNIASTLTGTALLNAIYHERRVELAGEGFRYHDLIRTNRAETLLSPLGFIKGKHELMPLPYSEITLSNGVLKQNNY